LLCKMCVFTVPSSLRPTPSSHISFPP
jgi:hypothetical protein